MYITKKLGITFLLLPFAAFAQNSMLTNPLLVHSNNPIPFNKVNATTIKEATATLIKVTDERINRLVAIPAGKKTIANTLMGFDEINYDLTDLGGKVSVIASTYMDDATRNKANNALQRLASYGSDLYLNEPLYKAMKAFSASSASKSLSASQKKFLNETLVNFEINGMKLDRESRARLKVINDKIIEFGNDFDKNLAESKDSIEFTLDQLGGVPGEIIAPWKRPNGKYMLYINGPNYINIEKYADVEATRHAMLIKYNNRAYPANIKALDSLFFYRQKLADVLGYKTYAQYALVTKMAAKPETVWSFLDDLKDKLTPPAEKQIAELKELKQQQHPEATELNTWDISYYEKRLLDTKYQLNTDEVKQYFEMNNVINGMFTVYQKLFNIKINETHGVPVWSSKVRSYELWMDGKKMGTFFLDLYPRPNKYTHFETANISQYRIANGKEVLPVGTLICNFPEGTATQPSLLDHQDVITMFHEFGHLIHFLLCHPVIASQNSFATKGDFVEAPSQFLENFCWDYGCLKLFAKNYKTGKVLPMSLFKKMKAAQNAGISIQYLRQVFLAELDFTYEDRYNSIKSEGVDAVERNLWSIQHLPYPEGSHFICGFNHLNSYGANYYGYLWSKVYAQDIFSVFEKHGVLDQATGIRYRKDILQEGAQVNEINMLWHFLGRQPNSDAFLKSIGL